MKLKRADQMYIHDWLIMLVDFDWTTDVRIAIHKDLATPKAIDNADCSSPDPDDDISRFGPGTSAHTLGMDDIDGLHADVNTVYCLVDDGLIDGKKATLIFTTALPIPAPHSMGSHGTTTWRAATSSKRNGRRVKKSRSSRSRNSTRTTMDPSTGTTTNEIGLASSGAWGW
jgi:hypothetical protein